jgi:hypothetical protein
VSRGQDESIPFDWSIDLIACCRTNCRRCTTCWYRTVGSQWGKVNRKPQIKQWR